MKQLRALAIVLVLATTACGSGDDTASTKAGLPASTTTTSLVAGPSASSDGVAPATVPSTARSSPTEASLPGGGALADSTEPAAGGAPADAARSVYLPPPGEYVYDVDGYTETTGLSTSREPLAPVSTDHVNVTQGPAAKRMTVITRDAGRDSSQEVVVAVTDTEARLSRLTYKPGAAGLDYSINPEPAALLARFPYQVDDAWEIAWNDPGSGIAGTGTGSLTGTDTVTTPIGTFETVVITVSQKLRGTITGTLTVTTWIEPSSGVQVKQHTVTDLRDATGASRTDSTRTLRRRP